MFTTHDTSHPMVGQTVTVEFKGSHPHVEDGPQEFVLEDWNDRVYGQSWAFMNGNPAALVYAMRSAINSIPLDNEVVYGKIKGFGHLVHVSEIVS